MISIKENIIQIKQQIRDLEIRYHRPANSVTLLAVSKNQSIEKILDAIDAGQVAFGENYLQEALEKITALQHHNLEWHFIGPIQSNKTRKIAENFSWVHSVADKKILQRLNDQRPAHLKPLNICLQVNVDNDADKSGVSHEEVQTLAMYCQELPHLVLRGLMTIPTETNTFAEQKKPFQQLRELYAQLKANGFLLDTLSMGMTQDMEAAIAEGATIVRIGTAIFGARDT